MNSNRWVELCSPSTLSKSSCADEGTFLTCSHIHYCWLDLHILFVLLPFSDLLRLVLPSNSPNVSVVPSAVLLKPVLGTPPPYFGCFPHWTYPSFAVSTKELLSLISHVRWGRRTKRAVLGVLQDRYKKHSSSRPTRYWSQLHACAHGIGWMRSFCEHCWWQSLRNPKT